MVDYGSQHRSRGVHGAAENAVRVVVSTPRTLVVILREDQRKVIIEMGRACLGTSALQERSALFTCACFDPSIANTRLEQETPRERQFDHNQEGLTCLRMEMGSRAGAAAPSNTPSESRGGRYEKDVQRVRT